MEKAAYFDWKDEAFDTQMSNIVIRGLFKDQGEGGQICRPDVFKHRPDRANIFYWDILTALFILII